MATPPYSGYTGSNPASGWGGSSWGNPFYNPTHSYGGTYAPGDWASTGAGDVYQGQNPESSWTRYASDTWGYEPQTAKGQFTRSLWPQVNEGFRAAQLTNPNLKIQDYVRGIDAEAIFNTQSARQRGENPGGFAPRAGTISRGY